MKTAVLIQDHPYLNIATQFPAAYEKALTLVSDDPKWKTFEEDLEKLDQEMSEHWKGKVDTTTAECHLISILDDEVMADVVRLFIKAIEG